MWPPPLLNLLLSEYASKLIGKNRKLHPSEYLTPIHQRWP
jgi:hypothetical protein